MLNSYEALRAARIAETLRGGQGIRINVEHCSGPFAGSRAMLAAERRVLAAAIRQSGRKCERISAPGYWIGARPRDHDEGQAGV